MSPRACMATAAVLGGLAVLLGAAGAHALGRLWPPARMATYQTAVLYHLVHALGLGLIGAWGQRAPGAKVAWAGATMALGMVVFSGSLYGIALFEARALGALAPVGGVLLTAGWLLLAWGAWTG